MLSKAIIAVIAAVLGLCAMGALGVAALLGGGANSPCITTQTTSLPIPTPAVGASAAAAVGDYDTEQVSNATIIIAVGEQQNIPPRGWVIAVATAIQESQLHNSTAGDHDSLGLFQQRPSQGWGTPDQIRDPVYASQKFYQKLLTIPNWQSEPLTEAAQAVQASAYPDAYAKWEADATLLVDTVVSSGNRAMSVDLEQCPSDCPAILSGGSPSPLATTDGCVEGQTVLARAAGWLTAWHGEPVPYLSSGDPATWFGGFRRDCSGYASMALGLAGPGLDTGGLAARSTPIPKAELRAGDLLINPTPGGAGHVVIFDHWTDVTMTRYVGYEQSGDGGTHHRTIPYPYFGSYLMNPFRYGTLASGWQGAPK